jgi:tRNA(Ile)-lysidine synthetase-like protein
VALVHALVEAGCKVEIAHFDHQTRGEGSAEDARFVEALAKRLGVPFHLRSEDVEAGAEQSPMSFEEYARERRYAFLIETAKERGCAAITTGHHADDQAETVLMRVLRGTAPRGIAGTPPVAEREGVRVVRPFLGVRRAEILAWLHERNLRYCHDETNLDTDFVRNRIRHELLPQLRREYNPRVVEALTRLADLARTEDGLLQSLAAAFAAKCVAGGGVARAAFAQGHRALQRRAVLEWAYGHGLRLDAEQVERAIQFILESPPHKSFDLGGGVRLSSGVTMAVFEPQRPAPPDLSEIPLVVPGETAAFDTRLRATLMDRPPEGPLRNYCTPRRQVFDARALAGGAIVRHRRPGDRIAPLGLGGTRKLKDYFGDLGLARHERDQALLVVARGEIVWIVGHAVSQHAAVSATTGSVAQIEVLDGTQ